MTSRREKSTEPRANRKRKSPVSWRRIAGRAVKVLLLLLVALVGLAYYAYHSAQQLPDFYRSTLERPPQELAESGAVFETRLLDLKNTAQAEGDWQAIFTEDQINGWLAVDLPRKFPDWLPAEISQPRVSIAPGELKFVCKFDSKRLSGIVVASADAFCTEKENEIGIRVRSVQSGIIPIPVKKIADKITQGLRKAGFAATWTEVEGDPVAIISLPRKITDVDDDRSVILTGISVDDKQLVLSGKTVPR